MTDGNIANAINKNEDNVVLSWLVWTGTSKAGVFTNYGCSNWGSGDKTIVGTIGTADALYTSLHWTNSAAFRCDGLYSLYCFEQ